MRFDMMDGVEGFFVDDRKCSGGERTDQQRPDQPWGIGDGYRIDIAPSTPRISQSSFYHWIDRFDMTSGGNFWYYTTILSMDINLTRHGVGKQTSPIFYHSGSGLVATTLNSQDFH